MSDNVIERAKELFAQNKNEEATALLKKSFNELERQLEIATKEVSDLRIERDHAFKKNAELYEKADVDFTRFSPGELETATDNYKASNKIGEGSYGTVYKGFLRHTDVAIKMLKPESEGSQMPDREFNQEVEILGKIRHPNLVSLIGASPEVRAVVYNYMPNGSLYSYLTSENGNKKILLWQDRIRIASEICTALMFLHSQRVAHGDLNPKNVLLDSNLVCKLSDFGMARKLENSKDTMSPLHQTKKPKGSLAYSDPEFLSFGELTPQSDVFSFGIILLQLVTGRDPRGLRNFVEQAVDGKRLDKCVDNSAGKFPSGEALKLAQLGLACSHQMRKRRSNLETEVWPILQSMQSMKQGSTSRGSKWF